MAETEISCIEDSEARAVFSIRKLLYLPECADSALSEEHEKMSRRLARNIVRSRVTAAFPITTTLTLEKDSPMLRIRTDFDNIVRDHRLRMLFPTDLDTDTHYADSVFDVVERRDIPGENWINPSRCQRMQYFAGAEDEQGGLAVINRGMYEYEILPERKTIAVTLLRSVGEMGDWGVFPTPDAQCIGPVSTELALLPYMGHNFRESGCREAVQFQTDMRAFPVTNAAGTLPERGSFLNCGGKGLAVTALKPSGDEKALILRVCNISEAASEWEIAVPEGTDVYGSCVTEEKKNRIEPDDMGLIRIPVRKKEIRTVRIEKH